MPVPAAAPARFTPTSSSRLRFWVASSAALCRLRPLCQASLIEGQRHPIGLSLRGVQVHRGIVSTIIDFKQAQVDIRWDEELDTFFIRMALRYNEPEAIVPADRHILHCARARVGIRALVGQIARRITIVVHLDLERSD